MKKIMLALIVFMSLVFLPGKSSASITTIQINSDITARYHLDKGQEVRYVTLKKGQNFKAELRDKRWYLKVGNAEVWISERFAKESKPKLSGTTGKNTFELVTKTSTAVFTSNTLKGATLATFPSDMRITASAKKGNYYEVIVGARRGFINAKSVKVDEGVPVIIYHNLVENHKSSPFKTSSSSFDVAAFKQQLNYLQKNKFYTISLDDLNNWMSRKQGLPAKAVIFTFDDANLSAYKYAYPLLKERNFFATTFVIGNRVKEVTPIFDKTKIQFSGINELREMQSVFDIEHHTFDLHSYVTAENKSILQKTTNDALHKDFVANSNALAKINPAIQAKYFSYPFGLYVKNQERVLANNGIQLAFLNKGGKTKVTSSRYYAPRVQLPLNAPLSQFVKIVTP